MREFDKSNLDLKVYRARVHDVGKETDDRIQVRIIPDMVDYPNTDDDNLPRYPMFIRGQVLTCYTELNPNPKTTQPDMVFVFATSDFTVGYVIGLANMFYTSNPSTPYQDSYGYSYIEDFISTKGLDTTYINYDGIVVDNWYQTNDGGMIQMHNYKSGDWYLLNSSGTCLIVHQKGIYIRVGNPKHEDGVSNPYSQVEVSEDSVTIKTEIFNVDAKKVVLGHRGLNMLGSIASSSWGTEGCDIHPITSVIM